MNVSKTPSDPRILGRQLRDDDGCHLEQRRAIVALTLTSAACMGLIALRQMGLIRRMPDVPFPWFNAEKVDTSDEAYEHLQMGDAFLGLGSYAVTAGLAAMGGKFRTTEQPWIPLLLMGKAAMDAASSARLTRDQWVRHRAFCIWCLIASGATFATAVLAVPEGGAAARNLLKSAKANGSQSSGRRSRNGISRILGSVTSRGSR